MLLNSVSVTLNTEYRRYQPCEATRIAMCMKAFMVPREGHVKDSFQTCMKRERVWSCWQQLNPV